jgi:hypothetical protein
MQQHAELAARDDIAQRPHRGPESPVMSDGKDNAGLAAGVEHPRGMVAMEREGLFAEHLLLGGRRRDHLRQMQRVRGRQQNGIDGAIGEHGVEIGRQVETVFGAKASRARHLGFDRAR